MDEIKSEKGLYIRTYTGKKFYPLSPDASMIDIRDVAHALSYICRGNGHVNRFYSVGQHCVNCALEAEARGYSERMILACLLHDASEAYMSDVPRPFKRELTDYIEMEQRLINIIMKKYLGTELDFYEIRKLKRIDDDLLYFDLKELLGEEQPVEKPNVHINISYDAEPFINVEKRYLEIYEKFRIV